MDTLLSLSGMALGGQGIAGTAELAARTAASADANEGSGDVVTFSAQARALSRTLVVASNAALASNASAAGGAIASNGGMPLPVHSLGLGVTDDGSDGSGAKDLQSLKQMIQNIKDQIQTVEKSSLSQKEKENKLMNLRSELARAQEEYQKAVLDGVGGIPRTGTPAQGMGSSLT